MGGPWLNRCRLTAALLLLAAAAAGCDWRTFDDIQERTPVLAVGAPQNFGPPDFGRTMLPISTPSTGATGGRFVVSGAAADAIAIIDVDAKGKAKGVNVTSADFEVGESITALAEVPGTNQVLLGAPGGRSSVYLMTMGATPTVAMVDAQPGSDRFGLGVAAGKLAGADAPELVVVSGSDLTVYLDGDPRMPVPPAALPATCPFVMSSALLGRDRLRRAVLVAPVMGDPAVNQIVVGTPTVNAPGTVSVFTVDAAGVATCAFTYQDPSATADARFGHALATGDFDADGKLDLLIGSPPSHAFWIQGPLTATSAVLPVTLAPGVDELGAAVAALNLDGKPGDEAVVGNHDADVGSAMAAGEVRIVTGALLDRELPVLRRHDPGAADFFGISVNALPFCSSGCGTAAAVSKPILLVGSTSRALTYFKLAAGDPDPRTP